MLPTLTAFRLPRHTCFSNPDFLETTGYCFLGRMTNLWTCPSLTMQVN